MQTCHPMSNTQSGTNLLPRDFSVITPAEVFPLFSDSFVVPQLNKKLFIADVHSNFSSDDDVLHVWKEVLFVHRTVPDIGCCRVIWEPGMTAREDLVLG